MVLDSATIDGAGRLDFGTVAGSLAAAANSSPITLTVNSTVSGSGGLIAISSGDTPNVIVLGADNRFLGGVTVAHGTLRLNHPGALNDNAPGTLTLRAGTGTSVPTRLELNGNSVTVNNLASGGGNIFVENSGSGTATLTVYSSANTSYNGQIINGSAGTTAFIKSGASTLTMQTTSAFSGPAEIRAGGVTLSGNGNGRWTGLASVTISGGGTLLLSNTNGNLQGDRIRNAAPVVMRSGTLDFSNDGSANNFTETLSSLTIAAGGNTVTSDQAGSANNTTLTIASLARNPGTVLNFTAQSNGTAANASLGASNRNRIVFTAAPPLNDGILGGWAFVGGAEFATYSTSGTVSVTTFAGYALDLAESAWDTSQNVKLTVAGTPALSASRVVNSLHFADGVNLDIGAGNTLNVDSGGLLFTGTSVARAIINGTLTSAGGTISPDLSLRADAAGQTTTIDSVIDDNGAEPVGIVKSGNGTVILNGANTYDGPTAITAGRLDIAADDNLGTAPAAPSAGHLKIYGGTLGITQNVTLDANRGIEIGGASVAGTNPSFSITAGTAGAGRTLTFNGSIAGTGDSNLIIASNATTTNVDPGKFNGTLSSPLVIGGDFRFEAGTLTLAAGANVVGRDFQVALNGTASLTQSGGTLHIGAGHVGDVFDVGVSGADSVAKNGTLNLAGVSDLTANVEVVRIGVVTGGSTSPAQGTVTFATNNTISARTSFIVADSGAAGLNNSTVNFGAGQNTIISPLVTLGGRKGPFTGVVPLGGTLRIEGFRERGTDLYIGRQNVATGSNTAVSLNIANGTFIANLGTLTIGHKSNAGAGTGGVLATLTLGPSAANSVEAGSVILGDLQAATGTAVAASRTFGVLNFDGGEFSILGDLALGLNTAAIGTAKGTLNIGGGVIRIGGDVRKTNDDRSGAIISISGGTLGLRDVARGDSTDGTMNLSQLVYRGGTVEDVASASLDGRDVTSGIAFGPFTDALILRDVETDFAIALTAAAANTGGIRYEAAGGGAGGVLGGALNLGVVGRTVNVEDNALAAVDLEIEGPVAGPVVLTKIGGGNLGIANTVEGGMDVLSGSLSGTATIAGDVNIAGGALIAPGFGSGLISTGNLLLNAGGIYSAEISGGGSPYDQINVTGSVTITDSTLALSTSGGPTIGDLFFLILNDGNDPITGQFANIPAPGTNFDIGPYTFRISYEADSTGGTFTGGNDVALLTVPEPGSTALVLGGLGALLGFRRTRRRN
jgi:fibronectin-binding autotransporter adhesin